VGVLEKLRTKREPPPVDVGTVQIDPDYQRWMEMEARRQQGTLDLDVAPASANEGDTYATWYKSGGYGYDPFKEREWILEETSLADYRGTCLDIGSGDGFWSVMLSEWYRVTGIDPSPAGIEVADAIKTRLPSKISRRIDYVLGDALEYDVKHDVVFCRAPSFLNYPVEPKYTPDMLDHDFSNLREVISRSDPDPESVDRKVREYASLGRKTDHPYANHFREYLEKMLSLTDRLFYFSMSTYEPYDRFVGDTYCHDPEPLRKLFSEYGEARVFMDKTYNTYVVGEIHL
jgi:SAM-dependent methyltransferase